jgi:hypothetical protein
MGFIAARAEVLEAKGKAKADRPRLDRSDDSA